MISMLCVINELLCVSAPLRENVFVLFTHPIGFVYSMFSRIIALSCGMLMEVDNGTVRGFQSREAGIESLLLFGNLL